MENLTEFVIGSDKRADLERRRVIHRDGKMLRLRLPADSERRRLENSFQKRQSCLAAFVFHFRASERAPPVFIVAASPRLASAADRGRHFHEDRRDASQKPRETVLVCHAARDGRRVRLASVIEWRAICSGKVIYASAAYDRFPRSATSPEEEEEKEERIRVRIIFNRYTFSTWSRQNQKMTKPKTESNPRFKVFEELFFAELCVVYLSNMVAQRDAIWNSYRLCTRAPFSASLIYRNGRV